MVRCSVVFNVLIKGLTTTEGLKHVPLVFLPQLWQNNLI